MRDSLKCRADAISRTLRVSAAAIAAAAWAGVQGGNSLGPHSKLESSGMAYSGLESRADNAVESVFDGLKTPGLSVAVTKSGRLVLTKGYGRAQVGKVVNMDYMTRARIGSVGKATVVGPSAYQLMKSKGIDPKTQTLYGTGGILGNGYDNDILTGVKRFSPIVAIAIGPDDHVFAWYSNGKFSSGTSRDFAKASGPTDYKLPEGKKPSDLRDVSFTKNGKVYAWYDDGTVSVGTPGDLGKNIRPDEEKKVSLPSGKSMLDIVGIGIAKSNDHVYAWYDDGTFSSGTSTDFDYYFGPKKYSVYAGPAIASPAGTGLTRYHIRSMDIASSDHVYTWFSNDHVITGMSDDLDRYHAPDPYRFPAPPPMRGTPTNGLTAYRNITIQHLLDHRSGFARSGDGPGAAVMFGTTEGQVTYDQIHRHFLRTNKLLFAPGTGSSYSNHGFGLWTLLIERISRKPLWTYIRDSYLNQTANLGQSMAPESASMTLPRDAAPYTYWDGEFHARTREDSTTGLAAGGFVGSARDLVLLTKNLVGKYSDTELDTMGWGRESLGKLHHNGRREGGTCYVVMFPKGYRSLGGDDLSEVHVALVANADIDTGKLEDLATAIALAVPASAIPSTYDVWKAKPAR